MKEDSIHARDTAKCNDNRGKETGRTNVIVPSMSKVLFLEGASLLNLKPKFLFCFALNKKQSLFGTCARFL